MSVKWPKVEKSHTYSSENADVYRAYDKGQADMLMWCKDAHTQSQVSVEEIEDIIKHHSISQIFISNHTADETYRVFEDINSVATAIHNKIYGGKS